MSDWTQQLPQAGSPPASAPAPSAAPAPVPQSSPWDTPAPVVPAPAPVETLPPETFSDDAWMSKEQIEAVRVKAGEAGKRAQAMGGAIAGKAREALARLRRVRVPARTMAWAGGVIVAVAMIGGVGHWVANRPKVVEAPVAAQPEQVPVTKWTVGPATVKTETPQATSHAVPPVAVEASTPPTVPVSPVKPVKVAPVVKSGSAGKKAAPKVANDPWRVTHAADIRKQVEAENTAKQAAWKKEQDAKLDAFFKKH